MPMGKKRRNTGQLRTNNTMPVKPEHMLAFNPFCNEAGTQGRTPRGAEIRAIFDECERQFYDPNRQGKPVRIKGIDVECGHFRTGTKHSFCLSHSMIERLGLITPEKPAHMLRMAEFAQQAQIHFYHPKYQEIHGIFAECEKQLDDPNRNGKPIQVNGIEIDCGYFKNNKATAFCLSDAMIPALGYKILPQAPEHMVGLNEFCAKARCAPVSPRGEPIKALFDECKRQFDDPHRMGKPIQAQGITVDCGYFRKRSASTFCLNENIISLLGFALPDRPKHMLKFYDFCKRANIAPQSSKGNEVKAIFDECEKQFDDPARGGKPVQMNGIEVDCGRFKYRTHNSFCLSSAMIKRLGIGLPQRPPHMVSYNEHRIEAGSKRDDQLKAFFEEAEQQFDDPARKDKPVVVDGIEVNCGRFKKGPAEGFCISRDSIASAIVRFNAILPDKPANMLSFTEFCKQSGFVQATPPSNEMRDIYKEAERQFNDPVRGQKPIQVKGVEIECGRFKGKGPDVFCLSTAMLGRFNLVLPAKPDHMLSYREFLAEAGTSEHPGKRGQTVRMFFEACEKQYDDPSRGDKPVRIDGVEVECGHFKGVVNSNIFCVSAAMLDRFGLVLPEKPAHMISLNKLWARVGVSEPSPRGQSVKAFFDACEKQLDDPRRGDKPVQIDGVEIDCGRFKNGAWLSLCIDEKHIPAIMAWVDTTQEGPDRILLERMARGDIRFSDAVREMGIDRGFLSSAIAKIKSHERYLADGSLPTGKPNEETVLGSELVFKHPIPVKGVCISKGLLERIKGEFEEYSASKKTAGYWSSKELSKKLGGTQQGAYLMRTFKHALEAGAAQIDYHGLAIPRDAFIQYGNREESSYAISEHWGQKIADAYKSIDKMPENMLVFSKFCRQAGTNTTSPRGLQVKAIFEEAEKQFNDPARENEPVEVNGIKVDCGYFRTDAGAKVFCLNHSLIDAFNLSIPEKPENMLSFSKFCHAIPTSIGGPKGQKIRIIFEAGEQQFDDPERKGKPIIVDGIEIECGRFKDGPSIDFCLKNSMITHLGLNALPLKPETMLAFSFFLQKAGISHDMTKGREVRAIFKEAERQYDDPARGDKPVVVNGIEIACGRFKSGTLEVFCLDNSMIEKLDLRWPDKPEHMLPLITFLKEAQMSRKGAGYKKILGLFEESERQFDDPQRGDKPIVIDGIEIDCGRFRSGKGKEPFCLNRSMIECLGLVLSEKPENMLSLTPFCIEAKTELDSPRGKEIRAIFKECEKQFDDPERKGKPVIFDEVEVECGRFKSGVHKGFFLSKAMIERLSLVLPVDPYTGAQLLPIKKLQEAAEHIPRKYMQKTSPAIKIGDADESKLLPGVKQKLDEKRKDQRKR